ncbi:MAG: hypothetical protein ACEQR4_07955, partial [Rhodoluna sp.]
VAEETHNLAKAIREGKTKRQRLLFDHREANADIDMGDEVAVIEGLRDNDTQLFPWTPSFYRT